MPLVGRPGPLDVILRGGSTARLREPTPADADALVAFLAGLSDESRYLRFHATCGCRKVDLGLVRRSWIFMAESAEAVSAVHVRRVGGW